MKSYRTGLAINDRAIKDQRKKPKNNKGIVIGVLFLLLTSFSSIENHNTTEAINTLEDLQEWIEADVSNGLIDSTIADSYLYNLEEAANRLKTNK